VVILLLVAINDFFINDFWWLFYCRPFVVILLMDIDGYSIRDY
jgi:hypothetical protein